MLQRRKLDRRSYKAIVLPRRLTKRGCILYTCDYPPKSANAAYGASGADFFDRLLHPPLHRPITLVVNCRIYWSTENVFGRHTFESVSSDAWACLGRKRIRAPTPYRDVKTLTDRKYHDEEVEQADNLESARIIKFKSTS